MRTMLRRKFTAEEKRVIIEDASKRGVTAVLRDHKLSYSVFARWKEKFQPEDIKEKKAASQITLRLKELTTENERLKKIIANQALDIQIKSEKIKELSTKHS